MNFIPRKTLPLIFLTALVLPGGAAAEPLALSLDEAVATALEQNLQLRLQKSEAEAAVAGIDIERGSFDPYLSADILHSQARQTSFLTGAPADETASNWSGGLHKKITTGTEFDLAWENSRYDTDNSLTALAPGYTSTFSFGFSHPLWQGNSEEVQTAGILAADKNAQAASALVDGRAVDLAAQVKRAYWLLVFARQQIEVEELSLTLAEKLLDDARQRIEAGVLAPVEIYQPESEVARREEALIAAERRVAAAEDELKKLLGLAERADGVLPEDEPTAASAVPELSAVLDDALARRPDLKAASLRSEAAEARLLAAEDTVRPSLDLGGRLGLGGTDDGYPQALGNTLDDSDFSWQLGLTFSLPLGNHTARGNRAVSRAALEQSRTSTDILRQEITVASREAVRNLTLAIKSIEASGKTTEAAEKRLEAEQSKFEVGLATPLDVLQAQEAYAQALVNRKQAVVESALARAEIERLRGNL